MRASVCQAQHVQNIMKTSALAHISTRNAFQAVPGPGQYNIPSSFQSGPTFTMAMRTPRKEASTNIPGPGAYEHDPVAQQTGPAFTVAARQPARAPEDPLPGPGAYYDANRDRQAPCHHQPTVTPPAQKSELRRRDLAKDTNERSLCSSCRRLAAWKVVEHLFACLCCHTLMWQLARTSEFKHHSPCHLL